MVRVQPYQFPFLGAQRATLFPDAGRHGDPAEIMDQSGPVGQHRVERRCGARGPGKQCDTSRMSLEKR